MAERTYVRLQKINGIDTVVEVIDPEYRDDGSYIPIGERYHPDFVKLLIDVTDVEPMPQEWWTYDGTKFLPPVVPVV